MPLCVRISSLEREHLAALLTIPHCVITHRWSSGLDWRIYLVLSIELVACQLTHFTALQPAAFVTHREPRIERVLILTQRTYRTSDQT